MNALLMVPVIAVAGLALAGQAAEFPPLYGDGVRDDAPAIQARLDAGLSCVYLPPPAKEYLISRTLLIGSNQELRLDRFTRIRLAPGASCRMLDNRDCERGGNRNIAVTGGIWDLDNARQAPNPWHRTECNPPMPNVDYKEWNPTNYLGEIMRFWNVRGVTMRNLTLRNPVTYCCMFAEATDITVDDITFDFDSWNPIRLNMDGIHLNGGCHHARLTNLKGTTFDDLVAINADDEPLCSPKGADISDVEVDGIHADYCHSAVRILSAPHACRRIVIRNVFGNFYTYAVGLTHYFPKNGRGTFEDILIENVFTSKVLAPEEIGTHSRAHYPLIWVEGPVDVGNLTVRNFVRDERMLPVSTIRVDKPATVRHLTVRDCRMVNRLDKPITFIDRRGKVETLTLENNDFTAAPGEWVR